MKYRFKSSFTAIAALGVLAFPVKAHMIWINVVPEFDHQVIASIAFGDSMSSGSELLTPDWWPVEIEKYDVIDPAGKRTALGLPKLVTREKETLESGMTYQAGGDIAQRKFLTNANAAEGTYQVYAQMPLSHIINYEDDNGKSAYVNTNINKLPKGVKVIEEWYNILLTKALFTAREWSEPEPIGMPLEIVSLSNLRKTHVGDKVQFQVLKNGEPYNEDAHIFAYNASFGDRWGLVSELKNGKGEFRLPQAGLWRVNIAYEGQSSDFDAYQNKKDMPIIMESSFTFNIKP